MNSDIKVIDLPDNFSSLKTVFDKYCNVFGIHIFATKKTPLKKVRWAANIMAEYLDNDGDGEVDNPLILKSMLDVPMSWRPGDEPFKEEKEKYKDVKLQSAIFMSFDENDQEDMRRELGKLNDSGDDNYIKQIEMNIHGGGQDLYASETGNDLKENNVEMFDASLEEILHLITGNGYANAYPEIFGENKDSEIAKLMDKARGGYFEDVPDKYPDDAWYTYYDKSCEYNCQITEYTYWGLLTQLNADWKHRINSDLVNEWKIIKTDGSLMTLKERDPSLNELLTDEKYLFPTILPKGEYKVKEDWHNKDYIETQYKRAWTYIYQTYKETKNMQDLKMGREILENMYKKVNKDFKGRIIIEIERENYNYYKYKPTYQPPPAPAPAPTPAPAPASEPEPEPEPEPATPIKEKELFYFDKSDIYTDIAFAYRTEDFKKYKSEIITFYEKSLLIKKDNWRNLQYYGIFHAQMNDKEGAEKYMKLLKEAIIEDGEIDIKWTNVIKDFQNYINNITVTREITYEDIKSKNRYQMDKIVTTSLPNNFISMSKFFDKYSNIFGIDVFKSRKCPEDKFSYILNFLTQLIDNDSDGIADIPEIIDEIKLLHGSEIQKEYIEYNINGTHYFKGAIVVYENENDEQIVKNELLNNSDNNNNKKILCLHGGGGDKNSMKIQKGVQDLMNNSNISNWEFIFAESPVQGGVWYENPPSKDEPTNDVNWADDSINYLDNFIENNGPFDAILGYSQGVPMTLIYLSKGTYKDQFNKIFLFNGYLPITHNGLMSLINDNSPFEKQTLIFISENDFGFYNLGLELKNKFNDKIELISDKAGHALPTSSDPHFNKILDFFNNNDTNNNNEKNILMINQWHKVIYNLGHSILSNKIGRNIKDINGLDEMDKSFEYLMDFLFKYGYSKVFLKKFDISNSELSLAMDNARGGYFKEIPFVYPLNAWYKNKKSLTYLDQMSKYLYWGLMQFHDYKFPLKIKNDGLMNEWIINVPGSFLDLSERDNDLLKIISDSKLPKKYPEQIYKIVNKDKLIDDINTKKLHFDNIIIGGGPAGIMCAYRLSELKPENKILIIEKGKEKYSDYKRKGYDRLNNWLNVSYDPNFTEGFKSMPLDICKNKVDIMVGKGLGGGTNHFGLQYIDDIDVLRKSSIEFSKYEWQNIINEVNKITQVKSYKMDDDYPIVLKNLKKILSDNSVENTYTLHNNKIYSRDLQTRFSLASLLENKPNITIMYNRNVNKLFGGYETYKEEEPPNYITGLTQTLIGDVKKIYFFTNDKDGRTMTNSYIDVSNNTNVVLCAGAINTTCILQRSGIASLKILNNSGVKETKLSSIRLPTGETIYDHGGVSITYVPKPKPKTRNIVNMPSRLELIKMGWNAIDAMSISDEFKFAKNINLNLQNIIKKDISSVKDILGNYSPITYYGLSDKENSLDLVDNICRDLHDSECNHKYKNGKYVLDIVNNKTINSNFAVLPDKNPAKRIIYSGINIKEDNVKTIRVFNAIQYSNIYIHTHYLDRNNEELLPSWLFYGMSYYFGYYWGEENDLNTLKNELRKRIFDIDSVNLKNMEMMNENFNYSTAMWAVAYLISLNENNASILFRKLAKDVYNKDWTDLFKKYFSMSHLIFYEDFKTFILNKDTSIFKKVDIINTNLSLKVLIGDNIYVKTKPHILDLGSVSSRMLGHIQTRDKYNKWQTYYSLIPDNITGTLMPIMVLTFADSGKINNKGFVKIKNTLNDSPYVKTSIDSEESINNMVEAFKINNKVLNESEFMCSDINLLTYLNEENGDAKIKSYFRKNLNSIYHYHGTCPFDKVVNDYQKIIGINNCYIGDISVLTSPIPGSTSVSALCTGYRIGNYLGLKKYEVNRDISKSTEINDNGDIVTKFSSPLNKLNNKLSIDINKYLINYPIEYEIKNENNLLIKLNKNKYYGIYCNERDIKIINGVMEIDLSEIEKDCDIYIWEKGNKKKYTREQITHASCESKEVGLYDRKRNKRGPLRSYAGVKWMSKKDHSVLPDLVRSILGRAIWATTDLYYILTTEYENWSENELFLIKHAFSQYEKVCKLKFIQTFSWDKADIEIKRKFQHPVNKNIVGSSYGPSYYGAEVIIYAGSYKSNNNSNDYPTGGYVGGWDYATFIHELGHAVGLMHPHEKVEGSTVMEGIEFDWKTHSFTSNNRANAFPFTVMSYNDVTSRYTPGWTLNYGYMSSLGPIDIAALQSVYGKNEKYNILDTIYELPNYSGQEIGWQTINDSGGIDTISAENSKDNVIINLNASDISKNDGSGLKLSTQKNIWGGFSVASGSDIENVIGGKYDDKIYENELANKIDGNEGIDTVYTLGRNDEYLLILQSSYSNKWKLVNINDKNDENILKNIEYIIYSNGVTQNLKKMENDQVYPETTRGLKISIKK